MVRCSTWQLLPLLVLQVTEIEGLLAKLDKTKKHLDNAEFVQAMGKNYINLHLCFKGP